MQRFQFYIIIVIITLSITFSIADNISPVEVGNLISESNLSTFVLGVLPNGSVIAAGDNTFGQCNVNSWSHIKKVCAGYSHSIGLDDEGFVWAAGSNSNKQCETCEWKNIVDVAADCHYSIGLKDDGSVVFTGDLHNETKKILQEWKEIIRIFATNEIHGITKNGDVVSTLLQTKKIQGLNPRQVLSIDSTLYILTKDGRIYCYDSELNQSFWMKEKNIVQIVDDSLLLMLTKDGRVISSFSYQDTWKDIIEITANFGVTRNGNVLRTQTEGFSIDVCKWNLLP